MRVSLFEREVENKLEKLWKDLKHAFCAYFGHQIVEVTVEEVMEHSALRRLIRKHNPDSVTKCDRCGIYKLAR